MTLSECFYIAHKSCLLIPVHCAHIKSSNIKSYRPIVSRVAAVRPGPTVQTAVFTIFYWTASLGPYYFHSATVTDGHGPNSSQIDGLTAVRLVMYFCTCTCTCRYLAVSESDHLTGMDPLKWWSVNGTNYPIISVLAKQFLLRQLPRKGSFPRPKT